MHQPVFRHAVRWIGAGLVAIGIGAQAVHADPPTWVPMLKMQIKETNGCDVASIVHWRDMQVGDAVGTEGRLRCVDGREYDFTRSREHQKFSFRLCQPAVC